MGLVTDYCFFNRAAWGDSVFCASAGSGGKVSGNEGYHDNKSGDRIGEKININKCVIKKTIAALNPEHDIVLNSIAAIMSLLRSSEHICYYLFCDKVIPPEAGRPPGFLK